jgi:hypothetical protein
MESLLKAEAAAAGDIRAGGGYEIIQQLVVDTTGELFPAFMHSAVLNPPHISHSTYEQPLPIPLQSDSAAGALSDGAEVPGKWHIYPEMISEGSFIADRAIALLAVRCA